jgi:hypothetical protein
VNEIVEYLSALGSNMAICYEVDGSGSKDQKVEGSNLKTVILSFRGNMSTKADLFDS